MKMALLIVLLLGSNPSLWAQLTHEQFQTLIKKVRWLEKYDIRYRESVRLPGEAQPWVMDCSNTVRYLAKESFGLNLPRVASGQYWELEKAGKVFKAPVLPDGRVDDQRLIESLASGDLLFWEWTYDIKRSPPITHVMIYLGRDAKGIPKMAGSSSSRSGGVGTYTFNPNAPMGGVRSASGGYKKVARFVGHGRLFEMTDHGRNVVTLPHFLLRAN
ncbi:MAG: NlpC/P60 family protein [Candidatus Methylacidiphilales bacterium]